MISLLIKFEEKSGISATPCEKTTQFLLQGAIAVEKAPDRIASFSVDHDILTEGIYISRIDGDITTYDMRTRVPNMGNYMDNLTMHSFEHMFATFVRSSKISSDVIYFGPMGCQTGFYLLVRNAENATVLEVVKDVLLKISEYTGEMFGNTRRECGNYKNLDVRAARLEAKMYLEKIMAKTNDFLYGGR